MLANIEAERGRKAITKDAMSKFLGITQTTYKRYVDQTTPIPSNILIKMGTMFDVSIDYLLGLTDKRR